MAKPSSSKMFVPRSTVHRYQVTVSQRLNTIFQVDVETEWKAMPGKARLYSPRLDIAVGPFAIQENQAVRYSSLARKHQEFLVRLYELHIQNLIAFEANDHPIEYQHAVNRNHNARCFLAIEIENAVSRKHLMGGAVNACALGRIGIGIGWNEKSFLAFLRMRRYLQFLMSVGKNTFSTDNLVIVSSGQFARLVSEFAGD